MELNTPHLSHKPHTQLIRSMKKPSSSSSGKKTPCCTKVGLKRGPWTPEEDELLSGYINREGEGRWRTLPKRAGLLRCGKSCRLRWMNYLRPSVKRGHIAPDEEDLILRLHRLLGNRWSLIAGRIPGRTDNEIKNYWNTHLSKKLISQGIDPRTHKPLEPPSASSSKPITSPNNKDPINEDDDINYCTDDLFSSFLNSLINEEDAYHHPANTLPCADSSFGAVGWESALISTALKEPVPGDTDDHLRHR